MICGKRGTKHYRVAFYPEGKLHHIGYACTQAHRREAQEAERARVRIEAEQATKRHDDPGSVITCDEWADRYVAKYERERKASSLSTVIQALKAFRAEFGPRPIGTITSLEAEDWAGTVPRSSVPQVVAVFNYALKQRVITHNPFAGLGAGRSRGRADKAPPTVKQLDALRDACDVLGDYAPRMRDLIDFAAYTLMRPGELYELRYPDVDLITNRITVARRLYRGTVDVPKNGRPKTIALVPPARAILLRQPTRTRDDGLVFTSKQGKRLTAPTLCQMWALVKARSGLDFVFYEATKHAGVHQLYKLGLSKRAIAAQAGWSEEDVDAMLREYGHTDLVALSEVDALYADNIAPEREHA
jgi:integrase